MKYQMTLNTSLKGRLRTTNLPKLHALFPLYEPFQTLDIAYKKSLIHECVISKRINPENMITEK